MPRSASICTRAIRNVSEAVLEATLSSWRTSASGLGDRFIAALVHEDLFMKIECLADPGLTVRHIPTQQKRPELGPDTSLADWAGSRLD
jgi:hypothetical protein